MYTVLFDGVCNLCNASVNFIIDRDKNSRFVFAALQSEAGRRLLEGYQVSIPTKGFDSIILIKNDKIYKRSDAALEIAKNLSGMWPLFYIFKIIPSPIRDIFYNLIAKNRYILFGKNESCRIPTPELKQKFL